MNYRKPLLVISGLGGICLLFVCFRFAISGEKNSRQHASAIANQHHIIDSLCQEEELDTVLTLVLVGDIMLGSSYPDIRYAPSETENLLLSVTPFLQLGDLTFGNLEGVISDSLQLAPRPSSSPNNNYRFKQPGFTAGMLKNAGFDFLSVANNHISDFGEEGRKSTLLHLSNAGIRAAGLVSHPWDTLTVRNVKVAFTAFATSRFCLSVKEHEKAREIVHFLDSIADIVVVSFHAGAEGNAHTSVRNTTEYYLGENRGNVHEFSRVLIDAGADVIFGHGPHVTRAIDHYKGRFIAYSLGNFCTYGSISISGKAGIAPIVKLVVKKDGSFLDGEIFSTVQRYRKGPEIDTANRALHEIQRLTKEDFPDNGLLFFDPQRFYFDTSPVYP